MKKKKQIWFKRLIALALTLVSLLHFLPAELLVADVEAVTEGAAYTPGDVNGDGAIDAKDVSLVRRYIVGGYDVSINALAADVDHNGRIDSKDVNYLRRYIAGGYDVTLQPGLESRTVHFEIGNAGTMADKKVLEGSLISSLPTPYWAEHIFQSWYYDAALSQPVKSTDRIMKDTTLYAGWLEQAPLDTVASVNFASAENVGSDFTITVLCSDSSMTAAEVLACIDADDLTDPNAVDLIKVSGADGVYTLRSNGGFREGCSYRIALLSDKLSFKDKDATARQYNFTVYRAEAMNLTTQDDITYIPISKVSNIVNNGQSVASLNLSLYESDGTNVTVADLSAGTFIYTEMASVKRGDIVCLYDGEIPTNRTKDTPSSQLGDMAYLEITGVNGSQYTYVSADAEDVVFTPDVLPMPENADTDSDAATITVENKYLDYSADIYSYNNLDSQTVVEAGDFLAFYTGDYGVATGENAAALTGYGKIMAVKENDNDTTTITYVAVTWAEVESCMDVYTEREMTAQELLEGVNTDEIESEIEQQAMESGFADEAAMYLTSLALATDNFTALSENMNLADYKVTLKDGNTVSPEQLQLMAGGGVKVEIEKTSVKAKISKSPTHLGDIAGTNADKKGIAISLDVIVVFTITANEADGHIEVTITGSFVEEVGVDFGASAEAIWDWAVFIPYISDIRATANIDVLNYTAVSFNATMITKENDDNDEGDYVGDAIDMANEIREMLEKNTDEESGEENHNKLIQKYSEMVGAESDWIRIVEKNITEVKQSFPPSIPLINVSFAVDFVVQMDASISVGFDFEYLEGKRHVFTISLKAGKVYADSIDLVEKAYEFCFYAMGRIGLKVGIEMEFSIYAISKKLGSVGFSAGAGAYTKLYGYFFYELKYTASTGKTQKYSGALLIQVGIYLELALEAQALGGRYSATANLLDKEWLLYEAGRRDNVLDFVTEQKDIPEMVMKQFVRVLELPDDFFNMQYLDLITGEGKEAVYNDWLDPQRKDDFRNGANFVITMTNDKFTYDPKTNAIQVHPAEGDLKVEGEMIITWKKQPMSFSSKPITRTISLYWDNLRDGYMIVPYTNGGSYVPMIIKNYEAKVTKPADPEKLGYNFAGWYSDATLETAYTFPKVMPAADTNVYAKWEPRTDISYTVEHYQENFRSGEYELAETEIFQGTTDTYVTPDVKTYEGFITPAKMQLKISPDGSAVLRYYYALERHNITFDAGQIDGVDVVAVSDVTYNLKYGAPITAPHMAMKGYTFLGWTEDGQTAAIIADTVGTEDLTYTAVWEKEENTEYRIEYYVQQADGRYTLQHIIKDTTSTGKVFTEEYLRSLVIDGTATADEKFLLENAIVFENMTVKGIVCTEAAVDGNGQTVVKINYGRVKHTLTFDPNYPGAEPIVKDVFYNGEVIAPQNVTRIGYTFVGWEVAPATVMPAHSLTYRAVWTPNMDTAYLVEHYQQQLDGTYALADTDNLTGTTDTSVTPEVKDYTGFTAPAVQTATILPDGSMVVKYQYTRNSYTLSFDPNGGAVTPESITAQYGASITLPTPTKEGYGFNGWYKGEEVFNDATMGAEDLTITAQWTAGKYGYTVNHYQQTVDGKDYVLVKTVNGTADMDSTVTPERETYEGFTAPESATTIVITADGTKNVVDYYYTRNQYTITWELGIGSAEGQTYTSGSVYYGAEVIAPVPAKRGYTFAWNKTPVTAMPAENLTYTANWTENTYTVVFHANNGTAEELSKELLFTSTLGENGFQHAGYAFAGWSDGVNTYGTDTPLSQIVTEGMSTLHLTALWQTQKYTITYMGAEENGHGNVTEYTVEDVVYLGVPNGRPGYTFRGWYNNGEFAGEPVEIITAGSTGHKIFYAMWEENTYTVVLGANDGTGRKDTYANLTYTSDWTAETPTRFGYTFVGWAYTPDGAVVCGENAKLTDFVRSSHASGAVIELYALWKATEYTITYNLGSHSASATHNNPATYSIETGADIVLEDLTPKSGFGFGGWYTNDQFAGEKVESISLLDQKDVVLYAKWEHAGTFSVSYTSVSNYKVTYTVKRTIPAGAVGTASTQNVYVRTQNGTAYGTTVDSTGQDKYHFIHSYAVLAFGPDDTAKTFTVTEKDDYLANYATASYQINNTARKYYVEIYKIENNTGGLAGTVGTGRITRTMPVSSYKLTTNMYRWVSKTVTSSTMTVNDGGYGDHTSYTENPATIYNGFATDAEKAYRDIVSDKYSYKVSFDLKEVNDGYQYFRLSTVDTNNKRTTRGEYIFATKHGEKASDWGRRISFPNIGTGNQGDILFNVGDCYVYESYTTYNDDGTKYAVITAGNRIKMEFDAGGNGSDAWQYRNLVLDVKVHDKSKPALQYAAPLATTAYKKGDTAYITVIYNEPINTISGTPTLTLSSKLSPYFENPTYVNNGSGTNALVFKVTAKKDITADEIQNVINLYLAYPISGVGGSFSTNIGTVSATVKDILGN